VSRAAWLGFFALALGCERATPEPTRSSSSALASSSASARPSAVVKGSVRIKPAPSGDVATAVRAARAKESAEGRTLLVYVGATWCEPCLRFHDAAKSGSLDPRFPTLTLMEFDLDEDRARLKRAGYESQYVPLFALPNEDGTASGKMVEGASSKGEGAVSDIARRLRTLVETK